MEIPSKCLPLFWRNKSQPFRYFSVKFMNAIHFNPTWFLKRGTFSFSCIAINRCNQCKKKWSNKVIWAIHLDSSRSNGIILVLCSFIRNQFTFSSQCNVFIKSSIWRWKFSGRNTVSINITSADLLQQRNYLGWTHEKVSIANLFVLNWNRLAACNESNQCQVVSLLLN